MKSRELKSASPSVESFSSLRSRALAAAVLLAAAQGFSESAGRVQINVDATRVLGTIEPFWASQIIHPTESLLTDQGKGLLHLMAESGAARQYVRIYNQPEEAIRVSADGKITYDWSRFDEMAALILAAGNKPKVVFFGMPRQVSAYPASVLKRPGGAEVCISPPKDYAQWEELCADFTRHAVLKYGLDEVKRWTFRCWNEPDLGFWHKADLLEYLKLYDYFAKGVKGVSPEVRIGGPALSSTRTYKEPKNFRFFLEHVANGTNYATGAMGSPIDFISVHTYGGSSGGGGPGRKFPDVDYMLEQQIRYADMRDAYPKLKGLPIHVEEWGESSGGTKGVSERPSADIRNSQYGAAFLVAWVERHIRLRQTCDRHVESFTFCASGYEKTRACDFMGYRTLDTKNGFHKPILNAYKLLNKVATELVQSETLSSDGHVTAFATRDDGRVTVVIVHDRNDRIDCAGEARPVTVKIGSPWRPDAKVTLKHWRIDDSHSNAYSAFKAMGSPGSPTPSEIEAIKKRMALEWLEPARPMTGADWSGLAFDLPCNAVSLIELVRCED